MTILHPTLRITCPASRVNDDFVANEIQQQTLIKHIDNFKNKNFQDHRLEGSNNDAVTRFFVPSMRSSLVYIITETVGDYPYPYLTEKTWKAMFTGVPFMIVGAAGSLKLLQSFGFKTFNNWWDESYDYFPTVADRINKIVCELDILKKLSPDKLCAIKEQITPILKYNQSHLHTFYKENLDNIRNNL